MERRDVRRRKMERRDVRRRDVQRHKMQRRDVKRRHEQRLELPPDPREVRHLAVIQLYFLGDTLLATPALRALRRRFPGALLEVVVKRRCLQLLQNNPHIDRLTAYDPARLWQRPAHWWSLGRRWRGEPVDLAVDLTADGRSVRLLKAMRPLRSVGFLRGNLERRVQEGIPKPCGEEHVSRHMLRLVALTGAEADGDALEFHPSAHALERARAWRGARTGPLVALHAGCNSVLRRWKLERFATLAARLLQRGARVWVLGGPEEAPIGALLAESGAEDWTGRLSLDESGARLQVSDLLVANDSGPMHLGAAVGTPTLALFGPSLPHTAAPLGPRHAHLHVRLDCCPCDQRRCVRPEDFCLDRITVDQVLARIEEMLAR